MTDDWLSIDEYDTYPKALRFNAQTYPDQVAMREKDYGLWRTLTWKEVYERVKLMGLALHALGIGKDDVVCLIGDNRPEWVCGEWAAHAVRASTLGLYRDVLDEEASYLIEYAQASLIFAEDEEQVDKILSLGDRIPSVKYIVYADPRGMRKYEDSRLIPAEEFERRGEELEQEKLGLFDELVDAGRGDDVAMLCTTSGTTSHPKLAMLQPAKFLRHTYNYLKADPKHAGDEYVSILPLPWIVEQMYGVAMPLISRITVNFVEEAETLMHDMREIGPTFLLLPPRTWESIAAEIRARIMDSSTLKRKMYDLAMKLGLEAQERGRRSWLADFLLFRALRDRFGFSRLSTAATGGAALGPDTFKFFLAMGVPLRQLYGQTELGGAYTIHDAGDVDFDTVGKCLEECEVRIDEPDSEGVGEIVTRNPNRFLGYYNNEEATKKDVRDDWMYTGDAGYFDDKGHLVVIDRVQDLAETSKGVRFSPQYIENKLKFSPYIAEAVILGSGRDYLAAMICIRFSIVSKWAEKNRISFTTYSDLSARQEVYELLQTEVEKVNQTLPEAQRIQRFLLLYKELDADDGELTRTRKVRRSVVSERYSNIIDTIYSTADSVDVDTTITFQDGSKQRIKTTLKIVNLKSREQDEARRPRAA